MNDLVVTEVDQALKWEVTIIFPRTESYGWGVEESRLIFNEVIIGAFTALDKDGWKIEWNGWQWFLDLVWNGSIVGIEKITINQKVLDAPKFPEIITAILADTHSRIYTVIVHDE